MYECSDDWKFERFAGFFIDAQFKNKMELFLAKSVVTSGQCPEAAVIPHSRGKLQMLIL